MPRVHRSALLPYPVQFVYEIVKDVGSYPQFLPWCGGVAIEQDDGQVMQAAIQMQGAGLNHWFKTRNELIAPESIEMTLLDGPFKTLHGLWRFTAIEDAGCKIELELHFEFKLGLASAIIGPAFTRIANTMVDSFCDRARDLYER